YLVVVEHSHADDVGGGDIGHRVGQARTGLCQRRHRFGAHVENDDPTGPVDQSLGHRSAHIAPPDIAEPHLLVGSTHLSRLLLIASLCIVVGGYDRMICPPSTLKICPVIQRASSESKNRHIPTRSSGVP